MNLVKPWHIIVLVAVIVLLFGAKRLPDLARSVGQSLKIFKSEVTDLTNDKTNDKTDDTSMNRPGGADALRTGPDGAAQPPGSGTPSTPGDSAPRV